MTDSHLAASPFRMPFGTEITPDGVRFRIFAPAAESIRLALSNAAEPVPMQALGDGWHQLDQPDAAAGLQYRFLLPDGTAVPDPASRFQSEDVNGPSEVIDPSAFRWQYETWEGLPWAEAVLYELHVGAFTDEGTFRAAIEHLDHLRELGVTVIELMALSDFAGQRNWGYDGVLPFAPDSTYGRPEDFKALIDAAHALGIAVVLDVVYNHFGPEGNYISRYFPQICSAKHDTAWGKGMNFDGEGSHEVREFFISNALFWLCEYRFDGLRLDASHMMHDESPKHILDEMAERARAATTGREILLILEDERNVSGRLMRSADGAVPGYTAQWNHDMTHLLSAAFGNACADRDPNAEETGKLATMLAHGYVLPPSAGEHPEDVVCKVPPNAFISFTQTHDLIGNRLDAARTDKLLPAEALRAITAILLLLPQTPMLFMGEEWDASTPFPFFSDYPGELGDAIRKGRCAFLKELHHASDEELKQAANPQDEGTFQSAKLRWDEINEAPHAEARARCRDLLRVRRESLSPLLKSMCARCGHVEVLGPAAFTVRWSLCGESSFTLAANLCGEGRGGFPVENVAALWLEGTDDGKGNLGGWSVRWTLH